MTDLLLRLVWHSAGWWVRMGVERDILPSITFFLMYTRDCQATAQASGALGERKKERRRAFLSRRRLRKSATLFRIQSSSVEFFRRRLLLLFGLHAPPTW